MKKTFIQSVRMLFPVVLLLLSSSLFAQFNPGDKVPVDPNVRIGKLPNGLTYYIRRNALPEKKVQLRLVVNAGSVLEDNDQQGLAHMMEHMNFNGSVHFPKNELVSYLQSIGVEFGADLNAQTGFDETIYILPIPTDDSVKVEKGFTILEDWAGNALLDTTEINKERGVVLEESRLGKGANERLARKYFPELFNGSKYAERLPIGKDDTIRYFKYSTLGRFYHDWYRPDLQAVIVVGDIDPAVAEQEIIKHFGHFTNPANERKRPFITTIPYRTVDKSMVLTDKEEPYTVLSIFNFVEKADSVITWNDYRKSIIEDLFSTIINQRLTELTQQADAPFAYAAMGFDPFLRGYRAFTSFAVLNDKPVKIAMDALVSTAESVKKFGFLQSELDRAKSDLLNKTEHAFEDKDKTESKKLVQGYIENFLSNEPIPGIVSRYKFMQQVLPSISLQEVNALAAKMENTQGKFVLLTAPEKNATQLPTDKQLSDLLATAHQQPVKPYEEKVVAKSLIDKLPAKGKIIAEKKNDSLGTTDLTLNNGITVTIKTTDFKNDEIQMDSWRWGGSTRFGLTKKMDAENAAAIIKQMGINDISSTDLEKFLAGKTLDVSPYINRYDEGIQGNSSVKDLETMLQLVYLYFTQPRKDDKLFQSYISAQKTYVQNLLSNPNAYFADTLSKIEFNNSPWAGAFPKAEDYDKINLDTVMAIYKNIYSNAYGWHFTFVGNVDVEKIKPLLETYLGSLPTSPKQNNFTDEGMRPAKSLINAVVKKGAEKKSIVIVNFTGAASYSKTEELKLKVLADVLTIKIIEQLREAMSGIYGGGMISSFSKRPYNNYKVSLRFPCAPENVDTLIKAAFTIIKNAREKGIEQKDLDKVKETLKKQNEDHLKENDHWLNELSGAWIEQTDPAWILDYSKQLNALTVQDIQATAQKYLDMQKYIKVVLYPEN